jgi:hypothetical protein
MSGQKQELTILCERIDKLIDHVKDTQLQNS